MKERRVEIEVLQSKTMREALQTAYPDGPPQGVDEIWFAHTAVPTPQFRELTPGRADECPLSPGVHGDR